MVRQDRGTGSGHQAPRLSGYPLVGVLPKLLPDPASFCLSAARRYGDVVRLDLGFTETYLVSHPAGLRYILEDNFNNFSKGEVWRPIRQLLGNGLSGSEGSLWQRQRRLLEPVFDSVRLAGLVAGLTGEVAERLATWQDAAAAGVALDVAAEMMSLTTRLMVRAVFGSRLKGSEANELARVVTAVMTYVYNIRMPAYFLPGYLLALKERSCQVRLAEFDILLDRLIAEGRYPDPAGADLLSMLMACVDEETGEVMPARQLRDEILTLFLGAYQTTPTALAWAWYLLAGHRAVEAEFRSEVDTLLGGSPPTFADLGRLSYTRWVIEETLRLYPPVWMFPRVALADDQLSGYRLPAGAMIWLSPFVTHRRPDVWEQPELFDPERFRPERSAGRPALSYLPFGAGARRCLGISLAMMQAQVTLAGVAQQYRLRLAPGHSVQPAALTALRPRRGIWMTVERYRRA